MGCIIMNKPIAYGVDDFKKLIDSGSYFVDKSLLINDVIRDTSEVKFIIRPRRFGKSLNQSMLYYFFSINEKDNAYLFNNLLIKEHNDILKLQNEYPVIFITLKNVEALCFEDAFKKIKSIILDVLLEYESLIFNEKIFVTKSLKRSY